MILAIASLVLSFKIQDNFVSSIFSNVFAGLITGISICFISGFKSLSIYNIETEINWLEKIHMECIECLSMHKELLSMTLEDREKLYENIYDLICKANSINHLISHSKFNKALYFSPERYCLKKLDYSIFETNELYYSIREKILILDYYTADKKDIRELFKDVINTLFILNGNVINRKDELVIKRNMMSKFII